MYADLCRDAVPLRISLTKRIHRSILYRKISYHFRWPTSTRADEWWYSTFFVFPPLNALLVFPYFSPTLFPPLRKTSSQTEHTAQLPTIDPTTDVIAVVGTRYRHTALCDDGWFFSDFFLFNQLFRGLGKSQLWYTAVEPDTLGEAYGEYVHGSPFKPR